MAYKSSFISFNLFIVDGDIDSIQNHVFGEKKRSNICEINIGSRNNFASNYKLFLEPMIFFIEKRISS